MNAVAEIQNADLDNMPAPLIFTDNAAKKGERAHRRRGLTRP
jgi:hypothetical protein